MARHSGNDRSDSGKEAGLSVVSAGMRITGQLDTTGVVKVEGVVVGSIRAERQVLVAKGGVVEGDILTREAIIGGQVRGAIYADERVEVQTTSQIHGDITTKRILLQEGGEVNGHLKMEDPKALSRQVAAVKSDVSDAQSADQPQPDIAEVRDGEDAVALGQQATPPGDDIPPEPRPEPPIRHIGMPRR